MEKTRIHDVGGKNSSSLVGDMKTRGP